MDEQEKRDKVISDVVTAFEEWESNMCCPGEDWSDVHESMNIAIAALKAQEPISDQDLKDLDILRRVKEGKLAKSLCRDYVIYNGEWYRNHKWDWPNDDPLEPRIVDGEPECGMCLYELRRGVDNYCPCCGRKVKWK